METQHGQINFADQLPTEVDVAIIGAGIAGVATAYFLAKQGKSVLLCEKGRVAAEQSSRNWGWVRQQGRDWAELPIMMESNRIWCELAAETGDADLTFTKSGCLYLIETEAQQATYADWYEVAQQHQLGTKWLTKSELATVQPDINGEFLGAMFTPSDGHAEPALAVPALARAAQSKGVRIIENCAVRTVDVEAGRVAGIVTEHGPVRASQVVLAGGAWSTHFAANAGLDLPQLAIRSTVVRTGPAPGNYSTNIATTGLTLRRRRDGGYTIATGDLAEHYLSVNSFRYLRKFRKLLQVSAKDVTIRFDNPWHFPGAWNMKRHWHAAEISPFERMRIVNPKPSSQIVKRIAQRLPKRFPALKEAQIAEAWAGMIDVTPDAVPFIGEDHRLAGLYLATGLSGHGFGIGPAVGRIMADILTGRSSGHDLKRFRSERFFDGSSIVPGPY